MIPHPDDEDGYWVKELVSTTWELEEEINHMTAHWDQWAPYNDLCPLKTDEQNSRAPAGCVAIAAAQVLYYLHDKWDVPAIMPSSGYCNDYVYNNPQQYFSNYNDYGWSQMSYDYKESWESAYYESLLIGYVGKKLKMDYGNGSSSANEKDIIEYLFPIYGIGASYGSYNEYIVKDNLLNRLPIIIGASEYLIPIIGNNHCFVIDGYRKWHNKYTYYHYWVSGFNPNPRSNPIKQNIQYYMHEPYYTEKYGESSISAIKINWGWWTQWKKKDPVNDGWYSLASDWTVTSSGRTYSYNHNVKMIYNLTCPH